VFFEVGGEGREEEMVLVTLTKSYPEVVRDDYEVTRFGRRSND